MAKIKVPYFTQRARVGGGLLYYWQPSGALRALGFELKRLSDVPALAIAEAEAENERVRQRRQEIASQAAGADAPAADTPQLRRGVDPRSVEAMLRNYQKTQAYLDLAPSTLRGYKVAIAEIRAWAGDSLVDAVTPKLASDWLAELAIVVETDAAGKKIIRRRKPYAASVGRVARLIWYAHRNADSRVKSALDVALNPFAHQRLSPKPEAREDPESILWSDDAVEAYVAAADKIGLSSIGTAIMLNTWLGQRMGDVLKIPREFEIELRVTQNKTKAQRALPIGMVPALVQRVLAERARLDARHALDERVQAHMNATGRNAWPSEFEGRPFTPTLPSPQLLISEATGLPYSEDHFRKKFQQVRDQVALDNPDQPAWAALTFMHTRHTAVTRMGEAGCSDEEISAISGHSLATIKAILERYMVRTRKMGRSAFRKRLAAVAASDAD